MYSGGKSADTQCTEKKTPNLTDCLVSADHNTLFIRPIPIFSSLSGLATFSTINNREMQTVLIKKAQSLITHLFLQGVDTHLP